jgi:hypothetical protein
MPADDGGGRASASVRRLASARFPPITVFEQGEPRRPCGVPEKRDRGERQAKLAFACRPRRPLQMRIAAHLGRHRSITLRATRPRLSEAGNGRMGRWRSSAIGRITSIAAPKPEGAKLRRIRT